MLTDLQRPDRASVDAAQRRPSAIVIGSGFGGLAAAIRLGARGYRVTVLEKQDRPGGRASAFAIDGFVFDAGPTIITATFLFEELWALCGRRLADDVTLVPLDPFYRVRFADGEVFDCSADEAAMRAQIRRLAPDDEAGWERFMAASEPMYRIGFEELGHVPFDSLWDMVKVAPGLVRLRGERSVHAHVARFVKNEKLRFVLSFHPLFVGGNPFNVTSVYALISHLERIGGVHYALSGTGSLVKGLAALVADRGGVIRLGAEVAAITVADGRATGVRLSDGETLTADLVVSNADVAWTYRHLLPATARRKWTDARLDRLQYSNGLFIWYFGTDRRYDDVRHHTISVGPRYRELIDDIFKHKRLADDFSLYLYRPTASDPSMAPEGCDSFYALVPVPNLQGDVDWNVEAEPFRRRIERALSETLLPDLARHVVVSRVSTPLDFRDRLLSYHGAGFSLAPVLWQSAWFRPHNRSEDVERLYFVGAGTHPGAGLPGVVSSAKVLDKVVPDARAFA